MSVITEQDETSRVTPPHQGCLLCGSVNPCSLQLAFQDTPEGGVRAVFHSSRILQGYTGIMHGGVAAALLDAAMTNCLFHHGIQALTGDLHVRYLHPVPCPADLEIRAWITANHAMLFLLNSEISVQQQVMVRAQGKFVRSKGGNPCPGR